MTFTNYGFAGEWLDASGLIYLRARYYLPAIGRFIARDVWYQDPSQPMSLNRWIYAYANPANLADPSGRKPVASEIGENFLYSCNCGWIDFHHANPVSSSELLHLVAQDPPNLTGIDVREDVIAVDFRISTGPLTPTWRAVVRKHLSVANQRQVALGMHMYAEQWRESIALAKDIFVISLTLSLPYGATHRDPMSGFSEEDLTSNIIGFNMAVKSLDARVGGILNDSTPGYRWLANLCGFDEDLKDAEDAANLYLRECRSKPWQAVAITAFGTLIGAVGSAFTARS